MDQQVTQRNAASLQRPREVVARLDDETMAQRLEDGWTVGEVLAHTAYWDQTCLARWDAYDREGSSSR